MNQTTTAQEAEIVAALESAMKKLDEDNVELATSLALVKKNESAKRFFEFTRRVGISMTYAHAMAGFGAVLLHDPADTSGTVKMRNLTMNEVSARLGVGANDDCDERLA